jgi:hypothetical protein
MDEEQELPKMMEMRSSGKMKKFIQEQNEIGWNQVVQGRISKTIIKVQNDHVEANKHITKVHRDPNRWLQKIIIALWSNTTTIWKSRCEEKYGKDREDQRRIRSKKLRARIEECYKKRHLLLHEDQKLYKVGMHSLITKNSNILEAWLNTIEPLLKENHHLEGQKRITEYFK